MAKRHAPNLPPRLLDKGQAAAYCGICPAVFDSVCNVRAIEMRPGLRRWDREALDRWISGLDQSRAIGPSAAWDMRTGARQ
jgi:hypothetical protein